MLLHLVPKCFGPLGRHTAQLLEFTLHGTDLHLIAGKDLRSCRPYPNKSYTVGCRADARAAENGFLVEAHVEVNRYWNRVFTTTARWGIEAGGMQWISEHVVEHVILDDDFGPEGVVSEEMTLWLGVQGLPSRHPNLVPSPPCRVQPRFCVFDDGTDLGQIDLAFFATPSVTVTPGAVARRRETFFMPTIEPLRLNRPVSFAGVRMPRREHAFPASGDH